MSQPVIGAFHISTLKAPDSHRGLTGSQIRRHPWRRGEWGVPPPRRRQYSTALTNPEKVGYSYHLGVSVGVSVGVSEVRQRPEASNSNGFRAKCDSHHPLQA